MIETIISLNGMCASAIKWRLTDLCNYECSYCIRKQTSPLNDRMTLKDNWGKIVKIIPEVARIIKELPGFVKLDLIGGECTIFNLHYLLEELFKICGEKLKRINLTTNMSQSADYYNDLTELCYKYNSEIGITCSWHYQFCSMDDFLEKFAKIKSPTNQKGIRVEAVSLVNNQPEIKELIKRCKENNFSYFIERDLSASVVDKPNLICESSKTKKDRYKVTIDSKEYLYKTRNEFLTSHDSTMYVDIAGHFCSRDYDYVYIEIDEHVGRVDEMSSCKNTEPLEKFHPFKSPLKCVNGICTLCGQMSISLNKEVLNKNEE